VRLSCRAAVAILEEATAKAVSLKCEKFRMQSVKLGGISLTKIIVSLISAAAAIAVALVTLHSANRPPEAKPPISFSGRVSDDSIKPIANANVIATADQSVAQTTRTDTNGLFQLQLAPETSSLRLTITADGFAAITVQANVHRTGPEEIFLHRLPAAMSPAASQQPKSAVKDHKATSPSAEPKPENSQPNQGGLTNNGPNNGTQNNCAPGVVNCNFSPNEGDQRTYYGAPRPPPRISFSQNPLPAIARSNGQNLRSMGDSLLIYEGENVYYSGVVLTIEVTDDFPTPVFRIVCDKPCRISLADVATVGGGVYRSTGIRYAVSSADYSNAFYVRFFVKGGLDAQQGIVCRLRSNTAEPLTVTSVTPQIQ
jgi:Carboxypeptidase regulatory-like domain